MLIKKYGLQLITSFKYIALSEDADKLRPKLPTALAARFVNNHVAGSFSKDFKSPLQVLDMECFEFYQPEEIDEILQICHQTEKELICRTSWNELSIAHKSHSYDLLMIHHWV